MDRPQHVPVLLEESLDFLKVRPGSSRGAVICDATLGLGGHSAAIAAGLGRRGRLICVDRDPEAMALGKARLEQVAAELGADMPAVEFVPRAFSELAEVLGPGSLDGLLADFGVSSLQLDEAHRGFSFRADGPLDMRMDPRGGETAEQVVNQAGEEELANLIYEFGEERRSRRIARAIVRARPITTTAQLSRNRFGRAPTINSQERGHRKGGQIHPATRTFQALRIRVNGELERDPIAAGKRGEPAEAGGRVVLISFHSLEDRLVKDAFRDGAKAGTLEVLDEEAGGGG